VDLILVQLEVDIILVQLEVDINKHKQNLIYLTMINE
jgi:hypothetical protein